MARICQYKQAITMIVSNYEDKWLSRSNFRDTRLSARAQLIADRLRNKYGQPLSKIFKNASELKRNTRIFGQSKNI